MATDSYKLCQETIKERTSVLLIRDFFSGIIDRNL